MAVHGGIAYAIGGWDEAEDEALASIESIPVATAAAVATAASPSLADGSDAAAGGASTSSEWSSQLLPDMPEPRCFAAATFDASGRLWVAGGGDAMSRGADCLTSIIRLDVDSGGSSASSGSAAGWDRVGDMLQPRCGLALAADGRTSTLYCCGGYSGGTCYQQTVETFDMSGERDGQMLPPMACSRSGCGAGVGPDGALRRRRLGRRQRDARLVRTFRSKRGESGRRQPRPAARTFAHSPLREQPPAGWYRVSRSDGPASLSMVHLCAPQGCWRPLPDLPTPRGYLSAAFGPDGCFYVGGGCGGPVDSSQPVKAFEAFDTRAGKWRTVAPMPNPRSNHALVLAFSSL